MSNDVLAREIASAINKHSRENESHTPDFILAEYLVQCLIAFEAATKARAKWYHKEMSDAIGSKTVTSPTPQPSPVGGEEGKR